MPPLSKVTLKSGGYLTLSVSNADACQFLKGSDTPATFQRPEVHAAFTNAGRESPAFPVNQICLGYITLNGVGLASREIRPCWALAQASTDHCFPL